MPRRPSALHFTEDAAANRLLARNGFALLVGMLLDQQFPMERAFAGPALVQERLGADLTPALVMDTDEETLAAVFRGPPAVHRYWGSMAKRTRQLAEVLVTEYGGDADSLWKTAPDGDELYRRLRALPGYGEAKARIFVGILGKRMGVRPPGWDERAADWPSVADVDAFTKVAELREAKKAMKAAAKTGRGAKP
ncbi:MAG: Fe-S cluster assembly protein HesB [Acidimicrobiia bacterium]|nr:Fe-S cluster assembly protein HesB [Acidimicrobiia bacterium]